MVCAIHAPNFYTHSYSSEFKRKVSNKKGSRQLDALGMEKLMDLTL